MMSIKPRKNGFSLVPAEEERNDETLKQEIGEVSSVSTSFTDKIKQQLPIAPPIVPIKPPPLMGMNFPNGEYHPDFMFCGACVTCEEPDGSSEAEMGGVKQLEAYLKQEDTMDASTVSNTTLLETKLQVRSTSFHSSQILMIKSLLQPLSGVANVTVDGEKQLVTVQHDASLSDKRVLDALNSIGHSATLQDQSSACSIEVRSQFFVAGICCTSEVPTVRRILRPVPGVSRIQINITTKVVHVCHDSLLISAQQISSILTNQGFPSQIRRDGQAQANPKLYAPLQGQTTLLVNSDISNDERPVIEQSLLKLKGIFKVELDFQEKLIFIDHDVYEVSSEQIVEQLRSRFDCRVMTAGEQSINDVTVAILDQIGRSKYVESTLLVERLRLYSMEGIKNAIFHTYIQKEVRAIYPNISSETIKIEHDPSMVSIMDIVKTLEESDITAAVTLDGRTMNLYLPTEEDNSPQNLWDEDVSSVLKVHFNVWLSGGFWVLSMLSYKGELENFMYFGLASVAFGLPPICIKAWRTIRRLQFDANCMMVTAALGALFLQQYDEAASVAFLFSISEFLEARASRKAREALKAICNLRPDHANVIHPMTKEIVVVPAERVPLGSLISVKSGDKIATDGIIVEGSSAVDESTLTGESIPIRKEKGEYVKGGTINIGRTQLVIKSTRSVEDSAVSRLIRLVEEAQSNRSPTERLVDAFARSYTPSVMLVAILMCTIPWISGTDTGRYWMLNGLIIVVIACPCSLTISTPVTYAAGLAATAQRGIIVKGGAKLEAMGSVDKIIFDKTGTLTKGKFSVIHLEVVGASKSRHEMVELLALVQERSSHPVASSLVQAAKDEGINIPRHRILTNHSILKGEGVSAQVDGESIFIGNQRMFDRLKMSDALPLNYKDLAKTWGATGGMIGFVGTENDGIVGIFCVKDVLREETKTAINGFRESGIDTIMCTGDNKMVADAVAQEIGILQTCVHSQLLPEDKLRIVESLKRVQPKTFTLYQKKQYILFCGDGVNDAPALAMADIGCSMGEGAAVAMEMSDVTLMDSNLTKLSYAISMGRKVLRTVRENILISLIGKLAVVAFTFTGNMTLLLAISFDVGIMLIVTLNGMKLLSNWEENNVFTKEYNSLETESLVKDRSSEITFEMNSLRCNTDSLGYSDSGVV